MSKIHAVSVRTLAEFAMEKGDLTSLFASAERMRDGVRGHQVLQEMLPPSWQPEAPVSRDIGIDGQVLRIHGRADAACIRQDEVCVLEIKTTQRDPARILKYDYPVHWAQAEIYAALFCLEYEKTRAEVRLTYARLDGKKRAFSEDYDLDVLYERLIGYARPYLEWVCALDSWREASLPTLKALRFPYDGYRQGQREMATAVYRAMRRGANALIEAPTGIGKTAAALFGALKALAGGYVTAVFYLTARTTGRRAVEDALDRMRRGGLRLRSVTITAKEKCCLLEQRDCMACPYAAGYYDRRRAALREAVGMQRVDAEAIRDLALEHELCPFELSLDISQTADVIICDYNYAFDPRVRIKRYFDTRSKAGLLVDEAHNLSDRAREMLSAEISGKRLSELCGRVMSFEGKQSPMAQLMKELLEYLRCTDDREMEAVSELPEEALEAIRRFAEAASELQGAEPDVRDFIYEAQWFVSAARQFDDACYRMLVLPGERWLTLRLWCFDPSKHLKRTLSRVGGAALFSATLAPMCFYAAQLGADGDADESLRLESPFPRENLLALRLPVSVSVKDRARTQHAVAQVIHAMAASKPGNYIACFPSYAYLEQAFRYYRALWPDDEVICQQGNMSEAQRASFIERFDPDRDRSMVAFIVLGGVFAEGVDLPGERLSGAAIVSTGMPQLSFERETLSVLLDDADDGGRDAAYTYPGIRRVLQAAGRVIRTETDRGVVLLLDVRYRQEKYRELMPAHWDVSDVKKLSELRERLDRFWTRDGAETPSERL